jgi:signal transduction histidine kinase/putative methionine-R-sulfoxide reductase with GAF domain
MARTKLRSGDVVIDPARPTSEELQAPVEGAELRSLAQLNMLHSLAARLNLLNDVQEIGDAVTAELRTLIDYHNCRIYLLQADGETLAPIAFRGELTEYAGETYEELVTKVGEGITGRVAETGESFYTPDALKVDFAVQIEGTAEIDESILAVPLRYGDRVTGVIVLSNLGLDQFDEQDMRLLEVLASHAATAFENARLFQGEREAAETSSALLALSQALTGVHDLQTVFARVVAAVTAIVPTSVVAAYVRHPDTGVFELASRRTRDPKDERTTEPLVDAETAARFLHSLEEPFVLGRDLAATVPSRYHLTEDPRETLVAPLRWDPDGFGALVLVAIDAATSFSERDLQLARGIADIASLALGSARRFHELERFHELVESLEAVFWEADPRSRRFTFLSSRVGSVLRGAADGDPDRPEDWGSHIHPDDRAQALAALAAAIREGGDHPLEYRALGPGGTTVWLRDIVHVVSSAQGGAAALRGLMVDVTERKRAEQALRRSERKYSEAFRREREATQRLRALDDMKNTFLEAVSHDLRTPLTSILGSALTLEQAYLDLPPDDSLDLIRRIAANSRKLERLLSDLLDVDRLQRGIVAPQRRPTDVGALVQQAVAESDLLTGRPIAVDVEPVVVNVDAAKVERIVENLLANAARHTPAGSRLWVSAKARDSGALIAVDDEGPGVPPEMREAIFEPFRQAPGVTNHSPGVGVGLSLVARFAELHGGKAWVEDRPGGGASFRVFLPSA